MANMANKCCCCSSVLSCFSCISARKNHTSPSSAHTSPSSAPPDSSLDAVPFSVADPSTSAAPSDGGSSSSTVQKTSDLIATMYKDAGGLPRENADLDDLIGHISQLLELIEDERKPFQGKPWAQSYLPTSQSYIKLKDFISEKDVNPSVAIKTVVSDVLQGMEIEHMVTTCFVVAANIAEKFKDVGDNKNECLTLLREMFSLAKHLRQFQERPPLMKTEKITAVIKEVTELIVEGSILCSTQINFSQFKFWAASVNKQELSKFTQKLREKYTVDEGNVDLDGLIKHISQLLDFIKANNSSLKLHGKAQEYFPTTSKLFSKLKKFLFDINDVIVGESMKRAVSDALKGMDAADLVTAGFVVVANILERFEDVRHNKNDCMLLLEEMISLAKLVKQFRERPELKTEEKTEGIIAVIKEPTELIVESSVVCCTQMTFSKFSKFEAVSNQEELSKFRQKLRDMYTRMNSLDGENVHIDGLINHISQLVCIIEGKNASLQQRRALEYLPTTSKILPKLKEFLDDAKDVSKDHTIKTTVSNVLEGTGVKDLVTIGLVVYATILERFQDLKDNINECINLLKEMFTFAKTIKKFEEHQKWYESEGISDAMKKTTESIVEGSILCYSHMESSKFYKLWEESMNKEALSKFTENLRSMLMDLNGIQTMPDLIDEDGLDMNGIQTMPDLIDLAFKQCQSLPSP